MGIRDALVAARALLIEGGVGRLNFINPETGRLCSLGALKVASGAVIDMTESGEYFLGRDRFDREFYLNAARALQDGIFANIVAFNDNHSDEEVIAMFDQAIARLDNETVNEMEREFDAQLV